VAFVKVAKVAELPAGSTLEVTVGGCIYALCNSDGAVTALDGLCLHRGGPLGHGRVHDGRVVCPWHLWEFDCRSGEYDYDPSQKLATYPVRIEAGEIYLDIPEPRA
jgi:nitrite reductase/ring-hydroxylating ferredoxin subunit